MTREREREREREGEREREPSSKVPGIYVGKMPMTDPPKESEVSGIYVGKMPKCPSPLRKKLKSQSTLILDIQNNLSSCIHIQCKTPNATHATFCNFVLAKPNLAWSAWINMPWPGMAWPRLR